LSASIDRIEKLGVVGFIITKVRQGFRLSREFRAARDLPLSLSCVEITRETYARLLRWIGLCRPTA
jgi:hypothetical protein